MLVVDDDPLVRRVVRLSLERAGCVVAEAGNGIEAQRILQESDLDVVVTDLRMPQLDGLGLMRWAAEFAPGPLWIILSGTDRFDAAVEAVRLGAYEFLSKPPHASQLQISVRNALERRQLERERQRLHSELAESHRSLAQKVDELEDRSEAMQRDLLRAEIIQRVLLPSEPPPLDGLCLHAVYRPSTHVGGDLYNVMRLTDRHLAIYIADATGHGVSSAMLSVLFHRKLVLSDKATGAPLPPADVFAAVNRAICAERIGPGLFLTAAYCLLDTVTRTATIALAGHPPALLQRNGEDLRRFRRTGPALGLTPNASYREEHFTIQAGDRLLFYTDGLLDSLPEPDDAQPLLESTLSSADHEGYAILARLMDAALTADAARDDDERDDITLLLLEARAGTSRFDNGAATRADASGGAGVRTVAVDYGESEEGSFFVLRGKGSWIQADPFHAAASGILDEGRTVVLDLAECDYLDSTFLGTIHELTGRSDGRGRFHLQNVRPAVRALFDELDMNRVDDSIREEPLPVPETRPLVAGGEPERAHARILHAHETLASLSARNREKFLGVVESLRARRDGS